MTNSYQLFAEYLKQDDHIQECLPPKKSGIDIAKEDKVCLRYNCYKRNGKPWDVKEGGDTDDIRNRTGMFLCPSRESLVLLYSGKAAAKSEEVWAGD